MVMTQLFWWAWSEYGVLVGEGGGGGGTWSQFWNFVKVSSIFFVLPPQYSMTLVMMVPSAQHSNI